MNTRAKISRRTMLVGLGVTVGLPWLQPITGYHETNFSMAYSSHVSWQDANSPVPMEVYPSLAFDSLFDNQASRRTASILDRVKGQAKSLRSQVSHADRAKLDEYLTSVRDVDKRVQP